MLIKSEEYFNETEQKQYIKNSYGKDEQHITFIEDRPVEFETAPPVHEPTNAEVAQLISDIQADLIISGVIS